MADIFLSYARADQKRVEQIVESLKGAGYSVWWDKHIKGGNRYARDIKEAMDKARVVLVAWSAASVESEWVLDEAAYGREHDKLVPIALDGTPPPLGFGQRQAIDLDGPEGRAQLHEALDTAIAGHHRPIAPESPTRKRPSLLLLTLLPFFLLGVTVGWYALRDEAGGDAAQLAAEQQRALAVLPFAAQSSGEDDQYFADGLTEEILNRLDALEELRVVPRTTAFNYRQTDLSLGQIADELKVGHVVEGSLRRSGKRVRVTARLIEAGSERTLWSENYEATTEDVFEVQADIAEKVASSLDVLLDESKLTQMRSVGIDNPEAFAVYAKAMALYNEGHRNLRDMTVFAEATELFDQAFAMDDKFTQALINAADFNSHILLDQAGGIPHDELPAEIRDNALVDLHRRLKRARDAELDAQQRRAIELLRLAFSDDWSQITALSRRFYNANGNCVSLAWPGFGFSVYGGGEQMFRHYEANFDCVTNSVGYWGYARFSALHAGMLDEFEALIERGESSMGSQTELEVARYWLHLGRGELERAREVAERTESPQGLRNVAAAMGDRDKIPSIEWIMEQAPYRALGWLAITGYQERADDWAARIDAAPAGPTTLQISVDECLCGAPFDISRTPNFRKRLAELGASWPPKSPIDWPLQKEPGR